ncbi:hypothetical protein PNOK_0011600 [Pyrrhoderma noxium]|uniref:Uncharacterized protein n=1 Tax=Pyrrhoderma noxium TaxID=2282107 RepID=A0A286UTZ3_9AGAM|nr:hypothetical protein PNOK_0011600 [Pyrrhoderma noxium]
MHATSVKTEDVGSSDFLTRSSSNDNKDKGKGSHVKAEVMEEIKGNVEERMITIKPEENSRSLDLSGDANFWERQAYWDEFDLKNYHGKVLHENGEEGVYEVECGSDYLPKDKGKYRTTKKRYDEGLREAIEEMVNNLTPGHLAMQSHSS